jgi:hypothetical protein
MISCGKSSDFIFDERHAKISDDCVVGYVLSRDDERS